MSLAAGALLVSTPALAAGAQALLPAQALPSAKAQPVTREVEIAREAYTFLYPLVIMDLTRRQATERTSSDLNSPLNTFHHNH